MKQFAIIVLLFLLIPVTHAQDTTTTSSPEIVEPQPIPPRTSYIDFDDIDDLELEDEEFQPPHWAIGDTIAFVSTARANLRSAPDTEIGVVADIVIYGERFPIVGIFYPSESTVRDPETDDFIFDDPGEREVWYLVEANGGAGWIFGGLVIVANPETLDALENRTLTAEEQAYIDSQLDYAGNTFSVRYTSRLRSGPGTNFAQIAIIPFQSRISIIGRNQFSTWFYVDYNGSQGWLHFDLLAFSANFDARAVPIVG